MPPMPYSRSLTPGPLVLLRSINSTPASSSARMSPAMLFGCESKLACRRGGLAVCDGATNAMIVALGIAASRV